MIGMEGFGGYYPCSAYQQSSLAQMNAAYAQQQWLAHQNASAALDWSALKDAKAVQVRHQIAHAKARYPAWFEPASEWDKIA